MIGSVTSQQVQSTDYRPKNEPQASERGRARGRRFAEDDSVSLESNANIVPFDPGSDEDPPSTGSANIVPFDPGSDEDPPSSGSANIVPFDPGSDEDPPQKGLSVLA